MKPALVFAVMLAFGIAASGQPMPDDPLKNFVPSARSTAVLITMMKAARQRGAPSMDVNDLVFALIAEDQAPNAPLLFDETPSGRLLSREDLAAPTSDLEHKPFFSPRLAVTILIKLNAILPRSDRTPPGTSVPTSAALEHVLRVSQNLPSELHQSLIEVKSGTPTRPPGMYQAVVPLDLLVAALREPCEATQMLKEAGITEEKVLETIRAGGDLEKGNSSETP